jgi:hypothetical protein
VISTGAEVEAEVWSLSNSIASSSTSESRLPDRLGTSAAYPPSELLAEMEMAGVVELASETGSQQKVSLFHNRQLRFSNLRPSSSEPAHLENTVHMLKRFSTLRVSTLWISPTSTVRTGVFSREGMVGVETARSHELWLLGRQDCCGMLAIESRSAE